MSTSIARLFFAHNQTPCGYVLWQGSGDRAWPSVYRTENEAMTYRYTPSWKSDRCSLCTVQPVWVEESGWGIWEGQYCMTHEWLVKGCSPTESQHLSKDEERAFYAIKKVMMYKDISIIPRPVQSIFCHPWWYIFLGLGVGAAIVFEDTFPRWATGLVILGVICTVMADIYGRKCEYSRH